MPFYKVISKNYTNSLWSPTSFPVNKCSIQHQLSTCFGVVSATKLHLWIQVTKIIWKRLLSRFQKHISSNQWCFAPRKMTMKRKSLLWMKGHRKESILSSLRDYVGRITILLCRCWWLFLETWLSNIHHMLVNNKSILYCKSRNKWHSWCR